MGPKPKAIGARDFLKGYQGAHQGEIVAGIAAVGAANVGRGLRQTAFPRHVAACKAGIGWLGILEKAAGSPSMGRLLSSVMQQTATETRHATASPRPDRQAVLSLLSGLTASTLPSPASASQRLEAREILARLPRGRRHQCLPGVGE